MLPTAADPLTLTLTANLRVPLEIAVLLEIGLSEQTACGLEGRRMRKGYGDVMDRVV
jgi:hypothetical protein